MKALKRIKNFLILCLLLWLCTLVPFAQSRRTPTTQPTPPPPPVANDPKPATIGVDDSSGFDGPTYTHKSLGFTLTLPQGWQAQDIDVQQRFAEAASQRTADLKDSRAAQASVARTKLLFIVVKPTDQKVNPAIIGMEEDITLVFSVRTPKQYIENMRRTVSENSPLVFDDQIMTEQVNGIEFSVIGASSKTSTIRQRYYATLRKNHALSFILTYDGTEQLQACMEILDSLKFQ